MDEPPEKVLMLPRWLRRASSALFLVTLSAICRERDWIVVAMMSETDAFAKAIVKLPQK